MKMNEWEKDGIWFWRKSATFRQGERKKQKFYTVKKEGTTEKQALDGFLKWKKEQEKAALLASLNLSPEQAVIAAGGAATGAGEYSPDIASPMGACKKISTLADRWLAELAGRTKISRQTDPDECLAIASHQNFDYSIRHFTKRFGEYSLSPEDVKYCVKEFKMQMTLAAQDKKLAKNTANFCIQSMKALLLWGYEESLVKELPRDWRKRTKLMKRTSEEVESTKITMPWPVLKEFYAMANNNMKAYILLALNCGFGSSDVALIKKGDVKNGYLAGHRKKTGVKFKYKLWPETLQAIKKATVGEPTPHEYLLSSSTGKPMLPNPNSPKNNHIFNRMAKYYKRLKCLTFQVGEKNKRYSFYSLRRLGATEIFAEFQYIQEIYLAHSIKGMGADYTNLSDSAIQAKLDAATEYLRGLAIKNAGI